MKNDLLSDSQKIINYLSEIIKNAFDTDSNNKISEKIKVKFIVIMDI